MICALLVCWWITSTQHRELALPEIAFQLRLAASMGLLLTWALLRPAFARSDISDWSWFANDPADPLNRGARVRVVYPADLLFLLAIAITFVAWYVT